MVKSLKEKLLEVSVSLLVLSSSSVYCAHILQGCLPSYPQPVHAGLAPIQAPTILLIFNRKEHFSQNFQCKNVDKNPFNNPYKYFYEFVLNLEFIFKSGFNLNGTCP